MRLPRSIHARMLWLSLLATLVALGIAGTAIGGVLERFVTQGLDQRLDAELALLASAVRGDGTIDRARVAQVRGALDGGPGWRWRIEGPGGRVGSGDFPELAPHPGPPGPADRPLPIDGEERGGHSVHARRLTIETSAGPVTLTSAAPRAVVARPIRAALMPLLAMLTVLGAVLAVASVVQLRLGLRPLRTLRDGVAAIRSGRAAAIEENQPSELAPLAQEMNALVREQAAALATARASAANLAHALKTPVATLALELRGDPAAAAQVERIHATIRHHLARARSAVADTRASTALAPAIADLVATIARLHPTVAIAGKGAAGLTVAVDAADLDEMVGNLLDNAARHARSAVTIAAVRDGGRVRITVADDGPGIPPVDRQRVTAPGVRLDERGGGDGFGLAIVRDLAELHGGTLVLDEAPGGGLAAKIDLPANRG